MGVFTDIDGGRRERIYTDLDVLKIGVFVIHQHLQYFFIVSPLIAPSFSCHDLIPIQQSTYEVITYFVCEMNSYNVGECCTS